MSRPDLTGTAESGRTMTGAWSSAPGQPVTEPAAGTARPQQNTGPRTAAATVAGVRPPGSRPSPRPRTAAPPAPAPEPALAPESVPDDVTVGNSPVSTLQSTDSAPEQVESQENGAESLHSPTESPVQTPDYVATLRDRVRAWLLAMRAYITPPQVWAEPPASMAELAAYARWGAWTSSTGPVRRLGIVWHRLVGVPVTTVCRYVEWIGQRPGRAIPVFLLWKLFISTGPGPALAAHVIRPVLAAVAWAFL
jgi:hypothetical protein